MSGVDQDGAPQHLSHLPVRLFREDRGHLDTIVGALTAHLHLHQLVIEQSLGDLASLAEQAFTKEQIANAFGVPLPFLTKETNLANLAAAKELHATLTVGPRVRRRDEKLNEQLVSLYDPTGRLFFRSEDPAGGTREFRLRREAQVRAWVPAR